MPEYHVSWHIEIHARSPLEAARRALEIQRDPESTATVFEVTDEDGDTEDIDLLEQGE